MIAEVVAKMLRSFFSEAVRARIAWVVYTCVADAGRPEAPSTAVARRLTGTHDWNEVTYDPRDAHRDDASDLYGAVEWLDRLRHSLCVRL